ncbi:MAG: molybdopterin-dependent oxidoreductase [Anaerolineae bacterium]|nr:molybdopterin-dependent oxidoreductase [Anaerolineae bacterium]
MASDATIELTVNGVRHRVEVAGDTTLLTFLRDHLGLTGSKNGCGRGHCGACTVIVDGRAQRACLLRMGRLQGAAIETIEGLSTPERVHALQYAFVRQGAVQCGFCTPGMIMAAKALLDRDPDPDEAAIRKALAHNLCRCTGYVRIVAAVREAAAMLRRGESHVPRDLLQAGQDGGVGTAVARLGGLARATGELRYTADLSRPGQLYGRALRSPYPHAEILSLDVTAARRMPGVVAVLTADDVPGAKQFGVIVADQPVLAWDRVRSVGDAVALVLAESEEEAEAALGAVTVTYRELAVVDGPEAALRDDAPRLHPGGNLLSETHIEKGDVAAGLARADVVIEGHYHTPFVEHAYLEPEACLAEPDGQGGVVVYVGSQGPWSDRKQVAASLALPPERVRIVHMPVGGAFGGKEDVTLQILAALGAQRTGRPVKMVMDRAESLRVSTKRHAEELHYRTGATRDGRLTAMEVTIYADTGAYASLGPAVLFRSATFACGPYVVPNVKVDAYALYTNNVPCGAMRGFGSPQVAFACECQMDELARRLGMDPFALRELNALEPGSVTATGDLLGESVGVKPTLEAVRQALARIRIPAPRPGRRIGVGVAASYKNVGLGAGAGDEAEASVELTADGTLLVRVGCADLGQGAETAMAQIAAEVTGVPLASIRVHAGDTLLDPPGAMTTASRETFITGNAVLEASRRWSDLARAAAAATLGCEIGELAPALRQGCFRDRLDQRTLLTLAGLASSLERRGERLLARAHYVAPATAPYQPKPASPDEHLHFAYCFGTQAAIVEVDERTGEVEVLHVIAAHDAGRVINPQAAEGQVEGGVMMGLGYALTEEFVLQGGQVVTNDLRRLGVPTIARLPQVTAILIENLHPQGPLGAKGMAELPAAATAPAIINAIYDAVGVRIRRLPATPARVLCALQERRAGADGHG